jgi:hypothetical protein
MKVSTLTLVTILVSSLTTVGCAEGKLVFGGKSLDKKTDNVVVAGTIDDTVPANPARDIVVFVYTNLRCCDPARQPDADIAFRSIDFSMPPFDMYELADLRFEDVEAVAVAAGSGDFEIDDVSDGDLTVVFLLDDPQPDGEANAGDLTAVLDGDELDNVLSGRSVTISGIDVDFDADFPEGVATPDSITVAIDQGVP